MFLVGRFDAVRKMSWHASVLAKESPSSGAFHAACIYTLKSQLYSGVLTAELAPKLSITSVTGYGITNYDGTLDVSSTRDETRFTFRMPAPPPA